MFATIYFIGCILNLIVIFQLYKNNNIITLDNIITWFFMFCMSWFVLVYLALTWIVNNSDTVVWRRDDD